MMSIITKEIINFLVITCDLGMIWTCSGGLGQI